MMTYNYSIPVVDRQARIMTPTTALMITFSSPPHTVTVQPHIRNHMHQIQQL